MSIPISDIVKVNPQVIGTGGNPLQLNGLVMSDSPQIPVGSVLRFFTSTSVANFFGSNSNEAVLAATYFQGFDNSQQKPAALLFAPELYQNARSAWLRSTYLTNTTLAQLQAMQGTFTITIDGVQHVTEGVNLASATSFSNAATLIQTAIAALGVTVTYNAQIHAFSINSPTLGAASTISYGSGTFADAIGFTQATGGVISQGSDALTVIENMTMVTNITTNWVCLTTLIGGNIVMDAAYGAWVSTQNNRYCYVQWGTEAQALVANSTTCFAAIAKAAAYDAVICVYGGLTHAGFVLGYAGCLDFNQQNGRKSLAFRTQSGLVTNVTTQLDANTLLNNGYTFYGAYANANNSFKSCQNGAITGRWLWLDTFINEVYLNSQIELAAFNVLQLNSMPYSQAGYSILYSALLDPVNQSVNFGAIRAGVALSEVQKATVNAAAGLDISNELANFGYYLQIKDPGAQVRGQRGSPIINLWYMDGGVIQSLTINSINIL